MRVDPARAHVYEHGWQSWSPTGLYPATATSPRPPSRQRQTMAFRPGPPPPLSGFQGEGLLAVVSDGGPVRLWAAADPTHAVPSIRARAEADRIVVVADGPVVERAADEDLGAALASWAAEVGPGRVRAIPAGWCSWYCHGHGVTEADVVAALAAIERLELPVEIVQVDDGHQACVGDWLETSPRFGSLARTADRIRATGRRPGIWTAPFLSTAGSRLAFEHPDWLVQGAQAGWNWGDDLRILDVTHPGAAEHLEGVYRALAALGFDYHKLDFLYAGAIEGRRHASASALDAYREGLRIVRAGAGEDAILVGCGAPLLPSIGLVDAMRISPDVAPRWQPPDGDLSRESGLSALLTGRSRGWMHARLWTNDPDCLLAGPSVEGREAWAEHVGASGGLVLSSDDLDRLDERGLELTRALLGPSSVEPVRWDPGAPDFGTLRP